MARKKQTTEVVKAPKKKKPLNYALQRVLKQNNFSPLNQLIQYVYPQLEPKDQMTALFKIMEYVYPKLKAVETRKRKTPINQTNVQVNLPDGSTHTISDKPLEHEELVKLINAAEGEKK